AAAPERAPRARPSTRRRSFAAPANLRKWGGFVGGAQPLPRSQFEPVHRGVALLAAPLLSCARGPLPRRGGALRAGLLHRRGLSARRRNHDVGVLAVIL